MSGIRTLQTVCLVRDDIQIIFFPVVCFEIQSLRKHQGSFFEHELLILPSTGRKLSYGAAPSLATAYQSPKTFINKISLIPQT